MIWVLYDTDFERAAQTSAYLMLRCGIEALPYHKARNILQKNGTSATFLVHCDAVRKDFYRLAVLRLYGKHDLRFYCTDSKDRTQQVRFIPEEAEKLIY